MVPLEWPSTTLLGGGDEVWEQATPKPKKRFTFGHWEVGKGKFCSREVVQTADGSMRVGQPANIKCLDFVHLGKMRKEQSGDANMSEKTAMRSVLGALGCLTRESRPDLSGPVSILQRRFNRAQVSNIQETNKVIRLAKAHTDIALPVCKFLWIKSALCLMEMPVVEIPVLREHKLGTGLCLLTGLRWERLAAPVTLVSWRSHLVKRVVARALGLSEAIAQVDWVRALWSEMVLGLSPREWREQENVPPLMSVTDSKGSYDHSHEKQSVPAKTKEVLLI